MNARGRKSHRAAAALLAFLALPAGARAQAPASSPHKLGGMTVQGSFRTRAEAWDWFRGDAGDNTYAFSGSILRVALSQSRERLDWQVELAAPFLLGLPDDAVAAGPQGQLGLGASYFLANDRRRAAGMVFVKQAFVSLKRVGGSPAATLRLGRFEFMDGSEVVPKDAALAALKRDRINQRLLGHFGWAHVGRSYDGLHFAHAKASGNLTLIAAIPTRGVFQTDGWGETRTAIGYGSYTRPWGRGRHSAETRLLALYYHDWRGIPKTDSRPAAVRLGDLGAVRIGTFGGHHLSSLATQAGGFDALLWGVAQVGRWGLLDHRAHAISVEGGFQPRLCKRLKPWLRAGFFDGSGDRDPADGTHDTFFQVLPTPRPFARFPFFNLMNNRDRFGMLILRPHPKITLSSEFHGLRLSNGRDLWYQGGGAYQPWTFGYVGRAAGGAHSLANLYDGSVDWRIRPDLTLTGYFGYAQGRAVTESLYPRGKSGSFGYLELTYKF
jgi:hypothetical protein